MIIYNYLPVVKCTTSGTYLMKHGRLQHKFMINNTVGFLNFKNSWKIRCIRGNQENREILDNMVLTLAC